MAHIGDLMVHHSAAGLNPFDAFTSAQSSTNTQDNRSNALHGKEMRVREQPDYAWRMHQPNQGRKYNLFPSKSHEKLLITGSIEEKKDNFGRELAAAMAAIGVTPKEKPHPARAAASPKEQKLERRKKPSVTDLGLMAAIHEASMDSPTIPGRFPAHERSISVPGHPSWRQSEYIARTANLPAYDNGQCPYTRPQLKRSKSSSPSNHKLRSNPRPKRQLAPLIIPSNTDLFLKRTLNRLSEQSVTSDTPPEVPPKSARMLPVSSPQSATTAPLTSAAPTMTPFKPYTPFSAPFRVPTMTLKSPEIEHLTVAPVIAAPQVEPAPLPGTKTPEAISCSPSQKRQPSPASHSRGQSESSAMLLNVTKRGHKRSGSDTSAVKQRGRAKQRPSPVLGSNPEVSFEALPSGYLPLEAPHHITLGELKVLGKQALGQAVQFEVLPATHVKQLSKELRSLDERCEYLRNTHRSLRAGRRNLHSRICDYLRSPRTAKFSFDSLLKQEEALAELDYSIDEWFCKLELAENRRMRIRQKLLEHVGAALLLPTEPPFTLPEHTKEEKSMGTPVTNNPEGLGCVAQSSSAPASATIERGPAWLEPATPASTASIHSHSPAERVESAQRLAQPTPAPLVARPLPAATALCSHPITTKSVTIKLDPSSPLPPPLPASWLSPTHEIIKCYQRDRDSYASTVGRPSAESIRIYAGEEVYRLLADVEEQIERMSFIPERKKGDVKRALAGEEKALAGALGGETEMLQPVRFESVRRPSPLRGGGGRE